MAEASQAIAAGRVGTTPETRHPINAARLLYSSPGWPLRASIHVIAILLVVGLVYACIGKKEEQVVIPVKLEREAVTIESLSSGIVTKILANEGDRVDSQTVILEVQQTRVTNVSEGDTLRKTMDDLQKNLEKENDEFDHKQNQLKLSLSQLSDSLKNISKDRTTQESKLATVQNDIRYKTGKLTDAKAMLAKQQELYHRKDITKDAYEKYRTAVDDLEKAVADNQAEEKRTITSLNAMNEDRIRADIQKMDNESKQNEERHKIAVDRLNDKIAQTKSQLKIEDSLVQGVSREGLITAYRSNFSGLITNLQVKPGHIVNTGTQLVTLVKDSSALVAKAMIPNKDIGRLKLRQKVTIRYFAYPVQEYGTHEGVVSSISTKPISAAAPAPTSGGAAAGPSTESMYAIQVAGIPETITRIGGRGKIKALEIGLEGTAEIKVGDKRLIELMFSPLSKFLGNEDNL